MQAILEFLNNQKATIKGYTYMYREGINNVDIKTTKNIDYPLAQKIVNGEVPYKLKDCEVFLVDLTALVSGTQFRGQFEARINGLLKEVKEAGNIILPSESRDILSLLTT